MEPSRHQAIMRLLKVWAERAGENGFAQRVTVWDVLKMMSWTQWSETTYCVTLIRLTTPKD
jgi:hypothetical protein